MRHRSGLSVCPARKNMVTPCISFSLTNRYHFARPSGCAFIIARFLLSKFLSRDSLALKIASLFYQFPRGSGAVATRSRACKYPHTDDPRRLFPSGDVRTASPRSGTRLHQHEELQPRVALPPAYSRAIPGQSPGGPCTGCQESRRTHAETML